MAKLFANRRHPDHMVHSVVSDLGLHYLPITLIGVSRLQWVKVQNKIVAKDSFFSFFLLFFSEIMPDISYESSAMQTIHLKCQALFSMEN